LNALIWALSGYMFLYCGFVIVKFLLNSASLFLIRNKRLVMSLNRKKMNLEWKGNFRFEVKNEKGLAVKFDAPAKYGGEETSPSPMETLLACLAGCTSYDVMSILRKKRQNISGYWVEAEAERAEEPPEVFTKISIKYIVKGKNVSKDAVERSIQLSMEKYCSVGAMLKKTAEIQTSYEIIQE
jgi:putative redox protein